MKLQSRSFREIARLIISPIRAFDEFSKYTLKEAFRYFLIVLLVGGLLYLASALLFPDMTFETGRFLAKHALGFSPANLLFIPCGLIHPRAKVFMHQYFAPILLALGSFAAFMRGVWTYCWVYIAGGGDAYETIRVVLHSYTPLLIAWIPLVFTRVNVAALIWMVILTGIGVQRFHKLSMERR